MKIKLLVTVVVAVVTTIACFSQSKEGRMKPPSIEEKLKRTIEIMQKRCNLQSSKRQTSPSHKLNVRSIFLRTANL